MRTFPGIDGIDSLAPGESVRNQEPKGGEEGKVLGGGEELCDSKMSRDTRGDPESLAFPQ